MKKSIAESIMNSVIGFDKWAEKNKQKFLEEHQEEEFVFVEDEREATQEELDTLESDEYDRRTCHQA